MTHPEKYTALLEHSHPGIQAYLYDCDGTLADNMPFHIEAHIRVAAQHGVALDGALITETAGMTILEVVDEINRRYNATIDPQLYKVQKYQLFWDEYMHRTQPIDFVVHHLQQHAPRARIAVVSGSSRTVVERTLQHLGIRSLVEVLVCAGETPRGKPAPDPFLEAARLLGVDPAACLVLEDAHAGCQAAEAAGMSWVRIDQLPPVP